MSRSTLWMLRVIAVVGGIIVNIGVLHAQSQSSLTMDEVMTGKELKDTGVAQLSPQQRAALDAWLVRYTVRVAKAVNDQSEKTRKPPSATPLSSCSPAVESSIEGDFNGWEGETVFKLSNGQIWEQTEYDYMYSYSYHPEVKIYLTSAGCRMSVEDESETILVRRIK